MQNNGHSDIAHDKNSSPLMQMLGLECVLGQKLGEERSVCFSYVWFTMVDIFIGSYCIFNYTVLSTYLSPVNYGETFIDENWT